jgi:hypothetical protein
MKKEKNMRKLNPPGKPALFPSFVFSACGLRTAMDRVYLAACAAYDPEKRRTVRANPPGGRQCPSLVSFPRLDVHKLWSARREIF